MKFTCINSFTHDNDELKADFKCAKKYENVMLGDHFLFFKKGLFNYCYISYDSLKFAFRRVMVVPIQKKEIQVDYLVIAEKRKELALIQLAGHNIAADILEDLKEKAPNAAFVCPDRLKR